MKRPARARDTYARRWCDRRARTFLLVKAISVFDFDGLLVFMLGVEWCL